MNINSRTSKINFTGFASDAIASFTGLREAPIKLRAYINAIQEGSGDPAPDNIRPISGRDSITITANSVDYDISLGDTIYGGILDVTTGVLTVDKGHMDLSDITSWTYSSSWSDTTTNVFYSNVRSDIYYPSYTYLSVTNCDRFSVGTRNQIYNKDGIEKVSVSGPVNSASITIRISNTRATDSSELITWLSNNPTHIIYELATPITVQLTPTQIYQIIGSNSISSDSGNVEVYYVTI